MHLPEIEFCEKNPSKVESSVINTYEGLTGKTLYPGDPVRLFLESLAAVIIQQRHLIDFSAKQNLVTYASGNYLDHLGAMVDTPRLAESAARVRIRFSLVKALGFTVTIPVGTRVTPDRSLYFATETVGSIQAGQTEVEVWASCQTVGAAGNGFVAGQVNKLVDPISYVEKVANITVSSGGADKEQDERYRERIMAAPRSFSVAGPDGAYLFWAKTAHQDIVDVSVRSPSPGQAEVRPLLVDGQIPGQAILDKVMEALSDRAVRPLTDEVKVLAPEAVPYDLTVDYWVSTNNLAVLGQIQSAVDKAVTNYQSWQCAKLGQDLNPDELTERMKSAGAKRVVIASPSFKSLDVYQVAQVNTVVTNYKGLEDE